MTSIRRFLLRRLLLLIVPVVVAVTALQGVLERRLVLKTFDESLKEKATTLATLITAKDGDGSSEGGSAQELEVEFADEYMPQYSRVDDPFYFQIWNADGAVLERSLSLKDASLPHRAGTLAVPEVFEAEIAPGVELRCLGIEFPLRLETEPGLAPARVDVVVATSREHIDGLIGTGMLETAAIGALTAAGIVAIILATLRKGLDSIRRVSAEVERIDSDSLNRRLDVPGTPVELQPIVRALNGSLDQIAAGVARERRINSDVAHELRTPLAELQTVTEVALRWPEPETSERALRESHGIALEMSGLVNSLLELSRLESRIVQPEDPGELRLAETVRAVLRKLASSREDVDRRVRVEIADVPAIRVPPSLPGMVVQNLIDNALDHGDIASPVEVRLRCGRAIELEVSNRAPDFDPADLPHLCEPLWRGDRSRNGSRHSGLGLTIVSAACVRMGAVCEFRFDEGVFRARLTIPLLPPAPAPIPIRS